MSYFVLCVFDVKRAIFEVRNRCCSVNYIDIIILLFLAYGAFRGFMHGFIVELATLLGLGLGVVAAIHYSDYTESILRDFLNISSGYISYIALGVTFVVVLVSVYILGKLLTKVVDLMALGLPNKLLGMGLGMIRYFVMVCVLLYITQALNEKYAFMEVECCEKSWFFYPFLHLAQSVYDMIRF